MNQPGSSEEKDLQFSTAAKTWFEGKRQEVSVGSAEHYEDCLRPLRRFFGEMLLKDIHTDHIVEYRRDRSVTCGPSHINQEISTLSQIMDRSDLWAPLARHYKPMRKPRHGPGQRIALEELKHLFKVAQKRRRWRVAYLCSLVSASTACGPSELLNLRLRDINFRDRTVSFVEGTKRDGPRVRTVPMTDDCFWALQELDKIALERCATAPEHYLLPHRAHTKGADWDPTEHQTHYRRAWDALRREAAKTYPRLATIRRYDLRHTALTMMAENPSTDLPTLKKIAGHGPGSRLVIDHYFHESMERKRQVLHSLDGLRGEKPPEEAPAPALVAKENHLPLVRRDYPVAAVPVDCKCAHSRTLPATSINSGGAVGWGWASSTTALSTRWSATTLPRDHDHRRQG